MANALSAGLYAAPMRRPRHIVDVLIEERAPRFSSSSVWPLVRPALYGILDYRKARAMADAIAAMSGREALEYVSNLLQVKVEIENVTDAHVSVHDRNGRVPNRFQRDLIDPIGRTVKLTLRKLL